MKKWAYLLAGMIIGVFGGTYVIFPAKAQSLSTTISWKAPIQALGTGWTIFSDMIAGYELTCSGWGESLPPTTTSTTLPSECAQATRWDVVAGLQSDATVDISSWDGDVVLVACSLCTRPSQPVQFK